jgi:hypothetical protein
MGASGNTETVLTEMQEKYASLSFFPLLIFVTSGKRDGSIASEERVRRLWKGRELWTRIRRGLRWWWQGEEGIGVWVEWDWVNLLE